MKIFLAIVGLFATTVTPQVHAVEVALNLDAFTAPQGPLTGAGTFNAVLGSNILLSERDVFLSSFPSTSTFSVTPGALQLTQTTGFTDVVLTYDGIDNSNTLSMGLPGLDLAGGAFLLQGLSTSSADPHAHIWFRAYTTTSLYSEIHLVLDSSNFTDTLRVPFSSLIPNGSGADFGNIHALQMELAIGSGVAMDLTIGHLSVSGVPEPSSISLLLGGALLAGFRRRSSRRSLLAHA